jgi:hypothetical protein
MKLSELGARLWASNLFCAALALVVLPALVVVVQWIFLPH